MTTAVADATGHQPECSDPADPLSRYSLISLFPRTLGILRDAPRPYDLGGDLDSLHDHLSSAALRSPDQLLEQARAIVEKKSEILNDGDIENRKRRRPGLPSHLRAQRPRFSLKPDFCSRSAMNLLENLEFDVGKYADPDEFFDAYEMFEATKRELEKLAGVVPVPNQSSIAGNRRPRRPGISRRRVRYNHLFADITESPQRTSQKDNLDTESRKDNPDTESPLSASQPEGVESVKLLEHAGSTGAENEASASSDDVFSSIFEDLSIGGVDVVNVLQERLQIKTFDIKSLQFPEMQELQHNDVKTPDSDLSKPRRAYLQNTLNSMHSKSPTMHGRVIEGLRSYVLSPTPPKIPLNVMNLLRKPLAEISSSIDPVSPDNLKSPVRGITQPTMCLETNSPNAKRGTYSGFAARSKLLVPEEVGDALCNSPQTESCAQNARHFPGKDVCDSYGGEESNVNIGSIQRNIVKDDGIASVADNENSGSCSKKVDANAGLSEKNVCVGDSLNTQAAARGTVNSSNIEDCDVSVELSQKDVDIESPMQSPSKEAGKPIKSPIDDKSGHQGKDQEKEKTTLSEVRKGKHGRGKKQTLHSRKQTSAAVKNLRVTDGTDTGKSCGNPVEHDEVLREESLVDRKKEGAHPCNVRQRKELNRRQSLTAAGTSWCGGVRRSTRIKSRPLEYWKGERFLYGRVHKSLATVIGIKYASPGKAGDGKSSFKVKSFVSDQYKDLVDLVALH